LGPRAGAVMNGFVAGGYAATAVILAGYAWRTIRRGKRLARALPAEPALAGEPSTEERTWR
ncbi:MAG: hypothetical protein ACRD0H_02810, partial [Actinomycetes bacterium]